MPRVAFEENKDVQRVRRPNHDNVEAPSAASGEKGKEDGRDGADPPLYPLNGRGDGAFWRRRRGQRLKTKKF